MKLWKTCFLFSAIPVQGGLTFRTPGSHKNISGDSIRYFFSFHRARDKSWRSHAVQLRVCSSALESRFETRAPSWFLIFYRARPSIRRRSCFRRAPSCRDNTDVADTRTRGRRWNGPALVSSDGVQTAAGSQTLNRTRRNRQSRRKIKNNNDNVVVPKTRSRRAGV